MHLAVAVCDRGARYFHLCLDLTLAERGSELGTYEMEACGARLEEYRVIRCL